MSCGYPATMRTGAAIARAMPMLTGERTGQELTITGGPR
jgi:hypothetical protein